MALVLFTDFGSNDIYVGQVKAVLERNAPGVPVIDALNDAPAFNVKAGAHLLASLVPEYPQGSVFLAVVDPGVGGERAPVAMRADGYRFVGPDNGLVSVFAARAARVEAFRIAWTPARLSPSFHGRDLFAPVAARIACKSVPHDWLTPLSVPGLQVDFGSGDLAEVIYVDHYGNAVTGLRVSGAGGSRRNVRLLAGGRTLDHAPVFSATQEGGAFWYENSQGLVEVAVNRGSAAAKLKLKVGTRVAWAT